MAVRDGEELSLCAIAHTSGVCAAILPQNFVRCATGMFRFDLESGEPIQPDSEVHGWKIQFVDAFAGTFVSSWVCDNTSFVRAVNAREPTSQARSFPYHSTSGGKTIERVIATGEETFVAVFSFVKGKQVAHSVEQWSLDSTKPSWEKRTMLKHVVRNDSLLMFWECSGPKLNVEILSLDGGNVETSFRLTLPDVVSIQPIDRDSYAVMSISGVYVLNANSKKLTQLPGMSPNNFLDFGALAVDASLGKLIVVTAGNHLRPVTHLTVLDL